MSIIAGIALKLDKVGPAFQFSIHVFHLGHPLQLGRGCNRREEKVLMPE